MWRDRSCRNFDLLAEFGRFAGEQKISRAPSVAAPFTEPCPATRAAQRSKLGDMDCERRLSIPHSAVIPPSTNSRAPVT